MAIIVESARHSVNKRSKLSKGLKAAGNPARGLDHGYPESMVAPVLDFLQCNEARRLACDLKTVRLIDEVYYSWQVKLDATCRSANVEMVTVNMQPAAAYALSLTLKQSRPFSCVLDIHHLR